MTSSTPSRAPEARAPRARRSFWAAAIILASAGLILRLIKSGRTAVLARDALAYLDQARLLRDGAVLEGLGAYYPPIFPLAIALGGLGLELETAGRWVAALAGGLAVIAVMRATPAGPGRLAPLLAGVACLSHSRLVQYGGELLSDSLAFLLLVSCAALACPPQSDAAPRSEPGPGRAAGAGLLGALATLTRPEAIILAAAVPLAWLTARWLRAPGPRRPGLCCALFLAVFGLGLAPYVALLHHQTGRWTFTRKGGVVLGGLARYADARGQPIPAVHDHFRDSQMAARLGETEPVATKRIGLAFLQRPGVVVGKALHGLGQGLRRLPEAAHPVVLILGLIGLVLAWRRRRFPAVFFWLFLGQLAVVSLVTPLRRYLVPASALFLIGTGVALEAAVERWGRARPRLWGLATALILALVLGVRVWRIERRDKRYFARLSSALAGLEAPGALCGLERRVAHGAGLPFRPLPLVRDEAELRAHMERVGARALLVRRLWIERHMAWFEAARGGPGWRLICEAGPATDRRFLYLYEAR